MTIPKNILIATIGSHGDVHPIMALGLGLQQRGHRVTLIASAYFESLVREAGLGFIGLGKPDDYAQTVENPDLWHPTRAFEVVVAYGIRPSIRPIYDIIAQQDPANTIVVASSLVYGARIAHEKLGVPLVTHHLQSSLIRSVYDPPVMGNVAVPAWWPHWLKRSYFRLLDWGFIDRLLAPEVNRVRAEVGLPPVKSLFGDWAHSPQKVLCLFPDWFAPPQPDWPANTEMVGFIRYDGAENSTMPPELEAFLQVGIPHLIMPLSHDQPDNARLVERLGVGAKLLPKEYRVTAVVEKLNLLLTSPSVQARCKKVASHIDFEQSLAKACDVIEQVE